MQTQPQNPCTRAANQAGKPIPLKPNTPRQNHHAGHIFVTYTPQIRHVASDPGSLLAVDFVYDGWASVSQRQKLCLGSYDLVTTIGAIFTGFDSAWTDKEPGAVVSESTVHEKAA